jgi:hypothetical protein
MRSITAFILFAWTAVTWFSGPYGRPFLGIPLFSLNPLIPFLITLTWSVGTGIQWLSKHWQRVRSGLAALTEKHRKTALLLAGILVFHLVVVSGPAILNSRGENDSDSALHGLAGYHIADGKERPMYVYGVHYVGSLKTHLAALCHLIFGKGPMTQRALGALFYCGFLIGLFFFVKRVFSTNAALLATLLAAIPPYAVAAQLRYEEFIEIPFWGIISLNLLLSITGEKRENSYYFFWYGVVLGLLFFAHPQAVYLILTGFVGLLAADRLFFLRRRSWLIPVGFVIGTVPTWVDSYFHDWIIFKYFFGGEIEGAPHLFERFAVGAGRFYKNLQGFWGFGNTYPNTYNLSSWIVDVLMIVVGIVLLCYIYISRKEIAAFFKLRNIPLRRALPLAPVVLIFFIFSVSVTSYRFGPFRYIYPLWLSIPVVIAAVTEVPKKRLIRAVGVGFAVLSLLLFSLSQWTYIKTTHENGEEWKRWVSFCKERNITRFYGDFWLVYQTNFITKEEIIGSSCFPFNYDPYQKYRGIVESSERPPAVVFSPQLHTGPIKGTFRMARFEKSLKAQGIEYRKEKIDGHIVFYDLSKHPKLSRF